MEESRNRWMDGWANWWTCYWFVLLLLLLLLLYSIYLMQNKRNLKGTLFGRAPLMDKLQEAIISMHTCRHRQNSAEDDSKLEVDNVGRVRFMYTATRISITNRYWLATKDMSLIRAATAILPHSLWVWFIIPIGSRITVETWYRDWIQNHSRDLVSWLDPEARHGHIAGKYLLLRGILSSVTFICLKRRGIDNLPGQLALLLSVLLIVDDELDNSTDTE